MVIIRDGKQIELTNEEMTEAYYEQQHKWDMEYVSNEIPYLLEEEESDRVNRLRNDKEFCDKVAHRFRKYLEDIITGEDEQYCWEDACDYVIETEAISV
jgi:hypothetical protein